jgi:hypothetical protein
LCEYLSTWPSQTAFKGVWAKRAQQMVANLRELPRGDEPQVAKKPDSETGLTEATYRCPKCGAIVNRWIKD